MKFGMKELEWFKDSFPSNAEEAINQSYEKSDIT